MGDRNPGDPRPRDPEPLPGSWAGRPLTDQEVHELGYAARDADGWWVNLEGCRSGGSTLTPEERRSRERQSQRLGYALRHAPHVVNANAMRDALVDAFGDRPMIDSIRRGAHPTRFGTRDHAHQSESFDWGAMRRRVDAQHAADVQRALNPADSQQPRETRRSFSVVDGGDPPARTGNRTPKADRAYGITVLDRECQRVADTPPGDRNNTLASGSFKVGRRAVGPGYIDYAEASSNLLGAALDAGLTEHEARTTIRSGLRAGARNPKDAA
jgi:hypothetical protein